MVCGSSRLYPVAHVAGQQEPQAQERQVVFIRELSYATDQIHHGSA